LAFILSSAAFIIFFVLAVFGTESIPLDVIPGNNR
jgi:hypothetical protein